MLQHLKAVWTFRYFWMALVKMDLRSRYRRSVLGIGWSMLHPLAMSAVFCVVFSSLMGVKDWRDYAAFLVCGMPVWGFILNSTVMGCHALIHNEAYIRQCPLPYGIYPLRTVMGTGVHFVISMTEVMVLVCLLKGSFAPLGVLWAVLPVMVLLFAFCWATATLAAFATVYFHDTSHLFEVGAQLMFFLTPIMYDRKKLGPMEWLADINPVNLFLELVRTPVVDGVLPHPGLYAQGVVLTAAAV